MAEKKREDTGFTVTDRRLFTSDGELRKEGAEEESTPPRAKTASAPGSDGKANQVPDLGTPDSPNEEASDKVTEMPPPPTAAEQQAQADAYRQSSKDLDSQVEISGHSAKEFEMTFERFLASLYMTAMLQLGLMREQGGQPRIDIIGARQTIDTLSLIAEKTKGNLTSTEQNFLQNSLYELRMAYVEVTNALAHPPQSGPGSGKSGTGTSGR
ncbi:MAG TPA: DUF1844 domain-containing protein [Verrucomicrobiae bacterium]|jgi:hypothetical protein|nr:DUF1844 domain-containing protein [Verrucomicrobiae bacterium]